MKQCANWTKAMQQNPSWTSASALCLVITICAMNSASWVAVVLALACVIMLPQKERRIFLTFALLASFRMFYLDSSQPSSEQPTLSAQGIARVQSMVRTANGARLLVQMSDGDCILLRSKDSFPLPGDSIAYSANLDSIRPQTIPGTFDNVRWLRSLGVKASGSLLSYSILGKHWCLERVATHVREWLRSTCARFMLKGTDGIMLALLVGDKSGLDPEVSQDFRNTGLVHILTVSGFHIVFLSAFLMMLLTSLRIPKPYARWLAVAMLVFFVPITGSSPSVQRAVLMFFLVQVASAFEREALSLHALGIACSCILLWDPASLFDIGFQLSAAATAGILLGQRNHASKSSRVPKLLRAMIFEPLWVTLCASLATLPLLVYHFQSFAPIGLAANLVVVPLMELAMEAGLFVVLFAWATPVAQGFGASASLLIAASTKLTTLCAALPHASMTVGPWPWWLCVVMLTCALAFPAMLASKRSAQKLVLTGCVVWCCWNIWTVTKALVQEPAFDVWFVDAGQGDATLLKFPNGKIVLIDVGNGKGHGHFGNLTLLPFLRSQGISHIDAVGITHPDLDHYGGAASLIDAFDVREIWMTGAERLCDKSDWLKLWKVIERKQIPVQTLNTGDHILGLGKYAMTVLNAPVDWDHNDWNATSLTLYVQGETASLVLSGDLGVKEEERLIQKNGMLAASVLKLGHHGSKHSSSPSWIQAVHPCVAIASAGVKNRYGHPSPEITQRLEAQGIPWWNTATAGSLRVQLDSHEIRIGHYWDGKESQLFTSALSRDLPKHH